MTNIFYHLTDCCTDQTSAVWLIIVVFIVTVLLVLFLLSIYACLYRYHTNRRRMTTLTYKAKFDAEEKRRLECELKDKRLQLEPIRLPCKGSPIAIENPQPALHRHPPLQPSHRKSLPPIVQPTTAKTAPSPPSQQSTAVSNAARVTFTAEPVLSDALRVASTLHLLAHVAVPKNQTKEKSGETDKESEKKEPEKEKEPKPEPKKKKNGAEPIETNPGRRRRSSTTAIDIDMEDTSSKASPSKQFPFWRGMQEIETIIEEEISPKSGKMKSSVRHTTAKTKWFKPTAKPRNIKVDSLQNFTSSTTLNSKEARSQGAIRIEIPEDESSYDIIEWTQNALQTRNDRQQKQTKMLEKG